MVTVCMTLRKFKVALSIDTPFKSSARGRAHTHFHGKVGDALEICNGMFDFFLGLAATFVSLVTSFCIQSCVFMTLYVVCRIYVHSAEE